MNRAIYNQLADALMSNPLFTLTDNITGIWFDFYMNLFLQAYYWPAFIAGKEDEWSQSIMSMLNGSNLCKPDAA